MASLTVGGTARALTRPTPWSASLVLLIGIGLLVVGFNIGQTANALFKRTQSAVATVDMTDRELQFQTWDGKPVAAPLITDCKQRQAPPHTGCDVFYESGDEVLISYDPQEPTRVWVGNTPGGGEATLFIAGGIAGAVAGVLGLWWLLFKPRLQAFLSMVTKSSGNREVGESKDQRP